MRPSRGFCVARGVAAGTLALAMLVGAAGAASADTKTKITIQQKRLAWLEGLITTQQDKVLQIQTSLKAVAGQVGATRRAYEALQSQIRGQSAAISKLRAQFKALRLEMDAVTAENYIQGPLSIAETVLDSRSMAEAADTLTFTQSVVARDMRMGQEIRRVAAQIKAKQGQDTILMARRAAMLAQLKKQRDSLATIFGDQQVRMAKLAQTREVVASLLASLRSKLRAEEIAAAEASLSRGTPLSFAKWATAFLDAIGAPVARNNIIVMVAWQTAEYTVARWNPLATTYGMPGATQFNSARVKNYVSLAQGIQATIKTLAAPHYGYQAILSALKSNADPMITARAINASSWCHGCANGRYVVELVPAVSRSYAAPKR